MVLVHLFFQEKLKINFVLCSKKFNLVLLNIVLQDVLISYHTHMYCINFVNY